MRSAIVGTAVLVVLSLPVLHTGGTWAEEVAAQPPSIAIPDVRTTNAMAFCVDCDVPFGPLEHIAVLSGLLNNPYVAELRSALYVQDLRHQIESKAHFDNCDFDSAIDYITSLVDAAGQEVDAAQAAKASGDIDAMQTAAKRAFFKLGQALHGVQDFYAHTNYVELQSKKVNSISAIDIITPWRQEGRDRITLLRTKGLVSGVVSWGFPKKCPSGTASHDDLAKDTADTPSGKRLIPKFQNLSQYRVAVFLAREASQRLIRDAFKRWPLLKQINGPNSAFEVLVDRRPM